MHRHTWSVTQFHCMYVVRSFCLDRHNYMSHITHAIVYRPAHFAYQLTVNNGLPVNIIKHGPHQTWCLVMPSHRLIELSSRSVCTLYACYQMIINYQMPWVMVAYLSWITTTWSVPRYGAILQARIFLTICRHFCSLVLFCSLQPLFYFELQPLTSPPALNKEEWKGILSWLAIYGMFMIGICQDYKPEHYREWWRSESWLSSNYGTRFIEYFVHQSYDCSSFSPWQHGR